ncbi:unnamed protein product [Linum trigynum]|uniref:KIB1-4 beta-propeller domain-containing protein n=1 Tax=Linum trigynum TaxID=586398 RepID=A0AAV2DRV0_9ROSI
MGSSRVRAGRRNSWCGRKQQKEEDRRPWEDLCPDLLDPIYDKLPAGPAGRMEFGSVCRNWRQVYRRRPRKSPAVWVPLAPAMSLDFLGSEIPSKTRKELSRAYVKYTWPGSGWLLLSSSDVGIVGIFNPLFRWPSCFVRLPALHCPVSQPPLKAAFSAPPTDPDWTVFFVRGYSSFSTFRRGELRWKTYTCGGGTGEERRVCEGIGYRAGSFFCLFDTGDVLVFGVEGERRGQMRSMLVAVAAPPVMLARQSHLRVVAAESDGKFLVMSWGRGGSAAANCSLLLLGVERKTVKEVEERCGWGSDVLVREQHGLTVEGTTDFPPIVVHFVVLVFLVVLILAYFSFLVF